MFYLVKLLIIKVFNFDNLAKLMIYEIALQIALSNLIFL